ncbi:MAG: 5-carboxymethyl-2-hydroxymuconate Delta-isomerase [Gammaproteobacteria bacterium]
MPHLVIEYSKGIEGKVSMESLMERTYQAAVAAQVMNPDDIKVRALPYSHYRLARQDGDFVHVTCRLLEGRTSEEKVRLSTEIRGYLSELLPDVYSLSVDIVDMNPDAYKKRLLDH